MRNRIYKEWRKVSTQKAGAFALFDFSRGLRTSFAELQSLVDQAFGRLESLDLPSWSILICQLPNSAEWLSIFLACQKRDIVFMPIDPDLPRDALKCLASSQRSAALWTREGLQRLDGTRRSKGASLIKLSSGSTGSPRPLYFEDEQILADGKNIMASMGIEASDSNLATIPFGHSYGLGNLIMPLVMKGCPIHLCQDSYPYSIAAAAAAGRPTVYPSVPDVLHSLTRSNIERDKIRSIRLWISAGSALDPKIAASFHERFGQFIHNFYGSSETGGIAFDSSGQDSLTGGSVGKPLQGVRIEMSASKRLRVRSQAVFTRYNRNRSEKTGEYLLPDQVSLNSHGAIQLHGRKARIVKIGSKRLSLAEVERALTELPFVEACYVDTYSGRFNRQKIAAVIVSKTATEEIEAHLKTRLSPWKIPARWRRLERLPRTQRGKLDRELLTQVIREPPKNEDKL